MVSGPEMESGAWPIPTYVHMCMLECVCRYKCVHMCVCLCVLTFYACVCAYGMGRDDNTCLVSIFFSNKVLCYLTPGSLPKDASLGDCHCAHIVGSAHPKKAMMSLSHVVLRNYFHKPMISQDNIGAAHIKNYSLISLWCQEVHSLWPSS